MSVSADVMLRRGNLRTRYREIESYFAGQLPVFHFQESRPDDELSASIFLRSDKFSETYLIDELETTYLLSMIGGLWCSIIGPIGIIVVQSLIIFL